MPSMKNVNPASSVSPNALKSYFLASRPKTWIASMSPVCIGAAMVPNIDLIFLGLTLLFALFIQIGANYANDYFDFINGKDTTLRNGPKRATQEGWIKPQDMLKATFIVFGLALLFALPLMMQAGIWSFFVAALCVTFGILYTGGPKPLGYLGLGELLVFPFFGPLATCGTYYLQTGTVTLPVFIASLAPGLFSCAILIANNLRDEKSDKATGKMTLVARFGTTFGRIEYAVALLLGSLIPMVLVFGFGVGSLIPCAVIFLAIKLIAKPALPQTALLQIIYTVLFLI